MKAWSKGRYKLRKLNRAKARWLLPERAWSSNNAVAVNKGRLTGLLTHWVKLKMKNKCVIDEYSKINIKRLYWITLWISWSTGRDSADILSYFGADEIPKTEIT